MLTIVQRTVLKVMLDCKGYKTVRAFDGLRRLKDSHLREQEIALRHKKQRYPKEHRKPIEPVEEKQEPAMISHKLSCPGCGSKYQYKFMDKAGFLEYSDMIQWDMKSPLPCTRCSTVSDSPYHKMYSITEGRFKTILSDLGKRNALGVVVCDIVGFPSTLPPDFEKVYPQNTKAILCLNKCDVMAQNPKKMEAVQRYYKYLVSNWEREHKFTFSEVVYVSGRTGVGLPELAVMLQRYMYPTLELEARDFCYLIGITNAGKSTMFNKLSPLMNNGLKSIGKVTESHLPGTTVDYIKSSIEPPSNFKGKTEKVVDKKVDRMAELLSKSKDVSLTEAEYGKWYKTALDLQLADNTGRKLLIDTPGVLHDNTLPESIFTCQSRIKVFNVMLNPGESLSFGWYKVYYINGVEGINVKVNSSVLTKHVISDDIDDEKIGFTDSAVKLESKLYVVNNIVGHMFPVGDITLGNLAWLSLTLSPGDVATVLVYGPRLKDISYRTPSLMLPPDFRKRNRE